MPDRNAMILIIFSLLLMSGCAVRFNSPGSFERAQQDRHKTVLNEQANLIKLRLSKVAPNERPLDARALVVVPSRKLLENYLQKQQLKHGLVASKRDAELGAENNEFSLEWLELQLDEQIEALRRRRIFRDLTVEKEDDPENPVASGYDATLYAMPEYVPCGRFHQLHGPLLTARWYLRASQDDEADEIFVAAEKLGVSPVADETRQMAAVFGIQQYRLDPRVVYQIRCMMSAFDSSWVINYQRSKYPEYFQRLEDYIVQVNSAWLSAVEQIASNHLGRY